MKYPKLRELVEAIRSFFSKPYTIKFPETPSMPSLRYRGKIEFDPENCVGCRACAEVCPTQAIEIKDVIQKKIRKIIYYGDLCIYCGECVTDCITKKGIYHTLEFDMTQLERDNYYHEIEKELILCERCSAPITTKEHLLWIAERIKEKSYANPTLMLMRLKELDLLEMEPKRKGESYRADHMRILCPSCRREIWLKETRGY